MITMHTRQKTTAAMQILMEVCSMHSCITNDLLAPYDPNKPKGDMDDDTIDLAYRMGIAVKKTEINKALPQNKLPDMSL